MAASGARPLAFWEQDNFEQETTPSSFHIACGDEDLVETGTTQEETRFYTAQLDVFMQHKAHIPDAPPESTETHGTSLLPTPPHHIRVLKLAPGLMDAPLIASLEQISLEFRYTPDPSGRSLHTLFGISFAKQKKVPYTAISYCWGDDDFDRPITVSGRSQMITATLEDILRHLRDPAKEVTLWADQLCIDQQNPADKESQVRLMGMVYARACSTVIWLGSQPGKVAFKALRLLSQATLGREQLLDEELEHLRHPKGEDEGTMLRLRALLCHPWFQRTWIIQEAVLARELYFMAKRDMMSWDEFAGYCAGIHELGIFDDEIDHKSRAASGAIEQIYKAKMYSMTHARPMPIFQWLVDTRYAGAKEPVDKVYGVLGLCDSGIVPDYSKSKEQVYSEVALDAVKQAIRYLKSRIVAGDQGMSMASHSMTTILVCIDHDTDPSTSKLPSWVPDWSQPRTTVALAYRTSCIGHYRPGSTDGHLLFEVSESTMTLRVVAKYEDKITGLSEVFSDDPYLSLTDPLNSNSTLLACINFFQQPHTATNSSNPTYFQTPEFWHSFCSTLIAGKDDIEGNNTCSEAYTEIFSFFCDQLSASTPTFPGQTYRARQKRKPPQRGGLTFEHFKNGKNGRAFKALNTALRNALKGRRLCWTERGFVGLLGGFAREGDEILTIPGCAVPFVMRRVETAKGEGRVEKSYTLVGESYVHGLVEHVRKDYVPSDAVNWVSIV